MEINTSEEVHAVCLFPTLEAALNFDGYVYDRLMKFPNKAEIFGKQQIYNQEDQVEGEEENLLINSADISFDRFGRIHVEPMVIGSFAEAENGTNAKPQPGGADEETTPEPSVVDVRVWYELIGQKVLEELITDLHANGHSMLTIKENGDIVVSCQKKKILKATLDSFPGKTYWKELLSILEENELKGKISDNSLQVSWI